MFIVQVHGTGPSLSLGVIPATDLDEVQRIIDHDVPRGVQYTVLQENAETGQTRVIEEGVGGNLGFKVYL